jgi:hypothetical protein
MPHYIEGNGVLLLAGKGYVSVLELFPLDGSRADDAVSFRLVGMEISGQYPSSRRTAEGY